MDLLKKMLETDPDKRPSARECLSFDFFIENDQGYEDPTDEMTQDA